jgi:hypothetical protein
MTYGILNQGLNHEGRHLLLFNPARDVPLRIESVTVPDQLDVEIMPQRLEFDSKWHHLGTG